MDEELEMSVLQEDKLGLEVNTNTNPSGSELLDDADDRVQLLYIIGDDFEPKKLEKVDEELELLLE